MLQACMLNELCAIIIFARAVDKHFYVLLCTAQVHAVQHVPMHQDIWRRQNQIRLHEFHTVDR